MGTDGRGTEQGHEGGCGGRRGRAEGERLDQVSEAVDVAMSGHEVLTEGPYLHRRHDRRGDGLSFVARAAEILSPPSLQEGPLLL